MKIVIVRWSWDKQVDGEELGRAVRDVYEEINRPSITPVRGTQLNEHALIVASLPISPDEAQHIYNDHAYDDEWLITIEPFTTAIRTRKATICDLKTTIRNLRSSQGEGQCSCLTSR